MAGGSAQAFRVRWRETSWSATAISSATSAAVRDAGELPGGSLALPPLVDPLAPVRVETIDAWVDPVALLRSVSDANRPVLLLSALPGHPASRYSILAWDPVAEIVLRPGSVTIRTARGSGEAPRTFTAGPFAALRTLLPVSPEARIPGVPFAGGAVGFLGCGLRTAVERLPRAAADPLDQPDGWFGVYEQALVFDHHERDRK